MSFFTNKVINIREKVNKAIPTAVRPPDVCMMSVDSDGVSNEP